MAVERGFFSAAPPAQNSPELHFRFINFFIQQSLLESLLAWNDGLASNHQPKVSKSNNLAENNYHSVGFTYHTMIFALIFVC